MNGKQFFSLSLNKTQKKSLASLFKDIGKTLIIGLMVNIFVQIKVIPLVNLIITFAVGVVLYLTGMLLEGPEDDG